MANHHGSLCPVRAARDGQGARRTAPQPSIDLPTGQDPFPQILAETVVLVLHKPTSLGPPSAAPLAAASAGSQQGENGFRDIRGIRQPSQATFGYLTSTCHHRGRQPRFGPSYGNETYAKNKLNYGQTPMASLCSNPRKNTDIVIISFPTPRSHLFLILF